MAIQMKDRGGDHDVPRLQPWLAVSMTSFLPILLELFVPIGWMWYLLALSGLTLLTGIVLLVAQEVTARRRTG